MRSHRYDEHTYQAAGDDADGNSAAAVVYALIAIGCAIGTGILAWAVWSVVAG